jgi:uncharacterized RmlC-like cupin family protein
MATFTKTILSGSTDGKGILVNQTTSGSAVTIHTGSSTNAHLHEVWLYAQNYSASNTKLTVLWGGTSAGTDEIELTVAAEAGLVLVVPGLVLKGNSSTAPVVKAFAASNTAVVVHGYVNTIT